VSGQLRPLSGLLLAAALLAGALALSAPSLRPDQSKTPSLTPASLTTAISTPASRSRATDPPREAGTTTGVPLALETEGLWFELGRSLQGRPIRAIRLGSGQPHLAVMGSIHGGWERNTERLVLTALEHFQANPTDIPPELSVYFVPSTNPDGLAAGNGPDAAWNARGADLNRNFATPDWSPDTFGRRGGRYGPSGVRKGAGGTAPFSEPETQAIRDFVLGRALTAVLSYHSGIVSVTARNGGGIGTPLARTVASITGYPYVETWTEYDLTGQFMDWLDLAGVRGVEVELPDQQVLDLEKNLPAIRAVMATLAAE
jgi:hypothetical protein